MDTFTITAYDKTNDVVTVTFVLQAQNGFAGGTFTGVKISQPPKDTVANVQAFFRGYVNAFIAGKLTEQNDQADISSAVKALLNVATGF